MSSQIGNKLKVQLFGQSHSPGLGVVMDGLPAGERLDTERIAAFLATRAGGRSPYTTKRAEPDIPNIQSGLVDGVTCGAPLCAVFENTNTRSVDYDNLRAVPRPSHADYTAFVKYAGHNDVSGGGHFSARLTLPLCFAGAVCLQILERKGISVNARIRSIGRVSGLPFGPEMIAEIEAAAKDGDSVGGVIEGEITGLPAGLGEPIFDNLESRLAYALFAVPAVKGVEFGAGFAAASMRASEYNDPFYMDNGAVKTKTNHSGGILGGITNGMPVTFRAAFKPVPSISKPQQSVNLFTGENTTLTVKGRHDPCVVPRAVPCVVSAAAIVTLDIVLGG